MRMRTIRITVASDETGNIRASYMDPGENPSDAQRRGAQGFDRMCAMHLHGMNKLICTVTAEIPIPDPPVSMVDDVVGTVEAQEALS